MQTVMIAYVSRNFGIDTLLHATPRSVLVRSVNIVMLDCTAQEYYYMQWSRVFFTIRLQAF